MPPFPPPRAFAHLRRTALTPRLLGRYETVVQKNVELMGLLDRESSRVEWLVRELTQRGVVLHRSESAEPMSTLGPSSSHREGLADPSPLAAVQGAYTSKDRALTN
jgi:hypothetical protein